MYHNYIDTQYNFIFSKAEKRLFKTIIIILLKSHWLLTLRTVPGAKLFYMWLSHFVIVIINFAARLPNIVITIISHVI
jgi:hypothetical protein